MIHIDTIKEETILEKKEEDILVDIVLHQKIEDEEDILVDILIL